MAPPGKGPSEDEAGLLPSNNTPPNHHPHGLAAGGAAPASEPLSTFGAAAALAEAATHTEGGLQQPTLLTLPPEVEDDDVRVAMIGNVDSGKSTLIGVLTHAALDDGRGSARKLVLKHRHEQENGRTSAVTVELMGYTEEGTQVVPTARHQANRWAEICSSSARSVTLIDLCGHERYLKTTVFGLTGAWRGGCWGEKPDGIVPCRSVPTTA